MEKQTNQRPLDCEQTLKDIYIEEFDKEFCNPKSEESVGKIKLWFQSILQGNGSANLIVFFYSRRKKQRVKGVITQR